jgi:hypothetical protein
MQNHPIRFLHPGLLVVQPLAGSGVARAAGSPGFVTGQTVSIMLNHPIRLRHPGLLVVRPLAGSGCGKGGRFPRVCNRANRFHHAKSSHPVPAPGVTGCLTPGWGRGVPRAAGSPGFVTGQTVSIMLNHPIRFLHPGLLVVRPQAGSGCAKGGRFPRVCNRANRFHHAKSSHPVPAPGVTGCLTPGGVGVGQGRPVPPCPSTK